MALPTEADIEEHMEKLRKISLADPELYARIMSYQFSAKDALRLAEILCPKEFKGDISFEVEIE